MGKADLLETGADLQEMAKGTELIHIEKQAFFGVPNVIVLSRNVLETGLNRVSVGFQSGFGWVLSGFSRAFGLVSIRFLSGRRKI